MNNNMICVGKILKPHGIKGEIKLLPLTDYIDERFKIGNSLYIKDKAGNFNVYYIENYKIFKKNIILKLKGLYDINSVEDLINQYIYITEKDLHPLQKGSYYIYQIIGLNVYEENGEYLGKIVEINKTGSNDVYIVKKDGKEMLLPALKKVVKNINIKEKTMLVKLLPGLR
jgi:16S rRNA processing protein RimM